MAIFNINDSSLNEDVSDIKSNIAQQRAMEKVRSKRGIPKRPKITNNMSDEEKYDLHNYDHGNSSDTRSNVRSTRGSGSIRDGYRQTSADYHGGNRVNDIDTKYYNKGNKFIGFAYKGTGGAKRKEKDKSEITSKIESVEKLKEAAEYILSVLDEMEY